jgi:hypothetical protein
MTAPVDVLVDRDDDVATIQAIHRLATDHSTMLAATIAPDWRSDRAVTWAILRALGKRFDLLGDLAPDWGHAERWLVAHHIRELIILRAQHLTADHTEHLIRMGDRADIAVVFVHSPRSAAPSATLTPSELLARPRRPSGPPPDTPTWPMIPRSHPWRLRTDCARQLSRKEFQRVDRLLVATPHTRGMAPRPPATNPAPTETLSASCGQRTTPTSGISASARSSLRSSPPDTNHHARQQRPGAIAN